MLISILRDWWLLVVVVAGSVVLLANATGAGLVQRMDYTGSPLSLRTCSRCHFGGDFGSTPQLRLLLDGVEVDTYLPGATYQLELSSTYDRDPAGYGFQLLAFDEEEREAIGDFGEAPTGTRLTTIGQTTYWEQSSRRPIEALTIDWVAPADEDATISFFYALNAVDASGGTSGDQSTKGVLRVPAMSSSVGSVTPCDQAVIAYPNPAYVGETVRWLDPDCVDLSSTAIVYDAQGRIVQRLDSRGGWSTHCVGAGMYIIQDESNPTRGLKVLVIQGEH